MPHDAVTVQAPKNSGGDPESIMVAKKIRQFRLARKMTVRELAQAAGVSPGFISQLENGRANGAIGTLRRIASALGLAFIDLFSDDVPTSRVLRVEERPLLPTRSGTRKYAVTLAPLQGVEIYISELEPGQATGDENYTHGDSQEIAYVLKGFLALSVSGKTYELRTGDSLEFRSSEPHHSKNIGDETAEVMWICCPPTLSQ